MLGLGVFVCGGCLGFIALGECWLLCLGLGMDCVCLFGLCSVVLALISCGGLVVPLLGFVFGDVGS